MPLKRIVFDNVMVEGICHGEVSRRVAWAPVLAEAISNFEREKRTMQALTRRPELDGLRGIAILLVLGYHGFGQYVSGGWLGVDVFFVLSGFLMGLILLPQAHAGMLELRDFFARRVRRLVPALIATVGVVSIASWFLLSDEAFRKFGGSALSSVGFFSNVFFWQNSGYFDTPLDENPLLHLWSVSIEGQFYVFLVLLLYIAVRLGTKSIRVFLWGAFLLSLVVSFSGVLDPNANFFLLPTRAWEFLAGVLLADVLSRQARSPLPRRTAGILGGLGVLVIVVWGIFADSSFYSPLSSLAVTLGTLAVIAGAHFSAVLARAVSTPALVGIGLVSYSLYLWHWPLLVFGRELFVEFGTPHVIAALFVSLVVSVLSWRYVEQPFRRRASTPDRSRRVALGVATATLSVGLVAVWSGAVGASGFNFQTITIPGYVVGDDRAKEDRWELIRANGGGTGPDCGDGDDDHEGWIDAADPRPGLVIIGNSHARDLYNVLAQSEEVSGEYQVGKMSCQLVNMLFHPGFLDSETYERAEVVILSSRYSDIDLAALPDVLDRLQADGKTVALAAPFPQIELDTR
ncbi:acyltransferase family protein, partial [Pontimonas sp.]|uniref:acyltransferase family protein n=1 Tax=Pontimonas sp. TaxID=2304492 RepID=UPI0028705391